MSTDFHVVIPARWASTRLPGKPLADIGGWPMIRHVWSRATQSGADSVVIATDDARVVAACEAFGADVMLTAETHESGTDRVAEVARTMGWPEETLIVNVQGDEPMIAPANIRQVAGLFTVAEDVGMTTLCEPLDDPVSLASSHVVKLVTAADGRAMYFSRAVIPHVRKTMGADTSTATALDGGAGHWRHVGLYGYRHATLAKLAASPVCAPERMEGLEQLRALWLGVRIQVAEACAPPVAGVDTEADLARVRRLLETGVR